MNIEVRQLNESDAIDVDKLGKPFRRYLGFLPFAALEEILRKGWGLGAHSDSGELLGYLIYASNSERFRITQLCVSSQSRGKGIARSLLDELIKSQTTQKVVRLRCRRDFPAHDIWPKLGFDPIVERAGRSREGHPLLLWCNRLESDDELGLWDAGASENVRNVVIDAQIFFDFDADDSKSSLISKGLQSDYLVDLLSFWITDEIFHEISRNSDQESRQRSQDRARGFHRVEHKKEEYRKIVTDLKMVLPYGTESEKSDLHHVAKVAASRFSEFVTKDEKLLRHSEAILSKTGVALLHPIDLIASLYEISELDLYSPSRVSGLQLRWRPCRKDDEIHGREYLRDKESGRKLRETLFSFLAQPEQYHAELLESHGDDVAYRIFDRSDRDVLRIPIMRIRRFEKEVLFSRFLICDCISLCANEKRKVVSIDADGISESLETELLRLGFVFESESFVRGVVSEWKTRDAAIALVGEHAPALGRRLESLSDGALEIALSPLMGASDIPTYLVPIRPGFAMGLIDRDSASEDLFGGDPSVLLRVRNVYYRSKSRHKMLKAPGRIIWYVSEGVGSVVAVSHLDEVCWGSPKELFKRFRKIGILEWRDILNVCNQDLSKEIMALRFSMTFTFPNRIPLKVLRELFDECGFRETLVAPALAPKALAKKIFTIGFHGL